MHTLVTTLNKRMYNVDKEFHEVSQALDNAHVYTAVSWMSWCFGLVLWVAGIF